MHQVIQHIFQPLKYGFCFLLFSVKYNCKFYIVEFLALGSTSGEVTLDTKKQGLRNTKTLDTKERFLSDLGH